MPAVVSQEYKVEHFWPTIFKITAKCWICDGTKFMSRFTYYFIRNGGLFYWKVLGERLYRWDIYIYIYTYIDTAQKMKFSVKDFFS